MVDNLPKLGIVKKNPLVEIPKYSTKGSACFDLQAFFKNGDVIKCYNKNGVEEQINIDSDDYSLKIRYDYNYLIPTGLIFNIPENYSLRIHSRSGLSLKKSLIVVNGEGIIDSDYKLETFIILSTLCKSENALGNSVEIKSGDRIAQAELVKNLDYVIVEDDDVEKLENNERAGGFGSTGV